MTDIDTPIPEGFYLSEITPTKAVLKEGITKKKGDLIYADEVECIIQPWLVYIKKEV